MAMTAPPIAGPDVDHLRRLFSAPPLGHPIVFDQPDAATTPLCARLGSTPEHRRDAGRVVTADLTFGVYVCADAAHQRDAQQKVATATGKRAVLLRRGIGGAPAF